MNKTTTNYWSYNDSDPGNDDDYNNGNNMMCEEWRWYDSSTLRVYLELS